MRSSQSLLLPHSQPVKLLHGVNCGPVSFGGLLDQTAAFRDARIPLIRLHDTNWPHPREVDYYTIFPDFHADASDPGNYDFASTDQYIRECAATGANILFRLGVSIEHAERKLHISPPPDNEQLSSICLGIVRHYTEGWADGFSCPQIKYWEIWNEPDLEHGFGFTERPSPTWGGTLEQFLDLYEAVSKKLKAYDPSLCVGGPGFANLDNRFCEDFLDRAAARELPLDFCSWHAYTSNLERPLRQMRWLRKKLDSLGYEHTLSLMDEWDYMLPGHNTSQLFRPGTEQLRQKVYHSIMQEQGAAFAAALLISMQAEPLDDASFFCADPCNLYSMFDRYGIPQKNYYAFRHFADAAARGRITGLYVPEIARGVFLMQTRDDRGETLLAANFSDAAEQLSVPAGGHVRITRTDAEHTFDAAIFSTDGAYTLSLPPYSVVSMDFTDARSS